MLHGDLLAKPTGMDNGYLAAATPSLADEISPGPPPVTTQGQPPDGESTEEGHAAYPTDDNWPFNDTIRELLDQNRGKEFFLDEGIAILGE